MYSLALKANAVAFACVTLVGCASNGALSPAATSDIQQALAVGCPILGLIQSSSLALNKYQKSALNTLALACPPNPPPTSAVVAVEDIIAAYTTLQPLLKH
jgi:hypothetical protein